MTKHDLLIYVTVCSTLNMSQAAKQLYISQPAVSRCIHTLEKKYKTTFFEHYGNKLQLTDSGKVFLIFAKTILSNFDAVSRTFLTSDNRYSLRIGAIPSLAETILPELITKIRNTIPEIILSVMVNSTDHLSRKLQNNELDVLLTDRPSENPEITEYSFFSSPYAVLAPIFSTLPNSISISELAQCDLLLKEQGSGNRLNVDALFSTIGLVISPKIESSSNAFLMKQCEAGEGLLIISKVLAKYYLKQYNLKMIELSDCNILKSFYISYHKSFHSYENSSTIIEMMTSMLQ